MLHFLGTSGSAPPFTPCFTGLFGASFQSSKRGHVLPDIADFFLYMVVFLFSLSLHEAAHAFVALHFGDETALRLGRVTLNPFKHIDPIGTILIPAAFLFSGSRFLFGYAKPVPVNFKNLRNPRRDMILVVAAGPATNFLLALISAILLKLMFVFYIPSPFDTIDPSQTAMILVKGIQYSIYINVLLAVFNMLPLPPLDGGRVMVGLLPPRIAASFSKIEPYGIVILLAVIFVIPILSQAMGHPINPFGMVLMPVIEYIIQGLLKIVGM